MSISRGEVVFTIDQAQRPAWRCGLVSAVEVIGQSLLQVAAVADVELAVGLAEEDVDAVAEFGECWHAGMVAEAGRETNAEAMK